MKNKLKAKTKSEKKNKKWKTEKQKQTNLFFKNFFLCWQSDCTYINVASIGKNQQIEGFKALVFRLHHITMHFTDVQV